MPSRQQSVAIDFQSLREVAPLLATACGIDNLHAAIASGCCYKIRLAAKHPHLPAQTCVSLLQAYPQDVALHRAVLSNPSCPSIVLERFAVQERYLFAILGNEACPPDVMRQAWTHSEAARLAILAHSNCPEALLDLARNDVSMRAQQLAVNEWEYSSSAI